jgi:hypothetical protein
VNPLGFGQWQRVKAESALADKAQKEPPSKKAHPVATVLQGANA